MRRTCRTLVALLGMALAGLALTGCSRDLTRVVDSPLGLAGTSAVTLAGETVDAPPPPRAFSMIAVGDVMLDRNVWKHIDANGYRSILEKVRDDLRSADITFANLECPLSTVGPHSPSEYLLFRANPSAVKVVTDGGIDVVALANNHALNAGEAGLRQTMDHLDNAGVAYCGAHEDRDRAWDPCRFIVADIELGFVACTDLSFGHGSWCKADDDLSGLRDRVAEAAGKCDLLAVSIHWGNEYQNKPTRRQKDVAEAAIEAGADLIIGHHPHVLQGVGSYQGVPILYSAGNFVFDQREGERMESSVFHLRFVEGEGWHIRIVPVWIPRSRMGPIYPSTERATKIINRMAELSGNLGVTVQVQGTEGTAFVPRPEPLARPQTQAAEAPVGPEADGSTS